MNVKIDKNRFSMGSFQYGKYPLVSFLDTAFDLGITQVELWAAAPHLCPGLVSSERIKKVREMLHERGLSVCCLTPEQCSYPVNLAAREEELREASLRYFMASIDMALKLECDRVLVTAGSGYYDESREEGWKRAENSLYQLAVYARKYNLELVLETLTPLSSNLVNTPQDQRKMIASMPAGSMSAMLDLGQMAYMGQDLASYLEHGTLLSYVHLQDSGSAIHMALGDGKLPLEKYLEQLETAGYRGMYSFEFNDARYRQDPQRADRQSIKWLKNHGILFD